MNDWNQRNANEDMTHTISVDALFAAARYQSPSLAEDPAARLLGLVPEATIRFDGRVLKNARMKSGLQIGDLARRLARRGWDISASDVFGWESGRSGPVAPALIAAVAEEVGVSQDRLVSPIAGDSRLDVVRSSERFAELARRVAEILAVPLAAAIAKLETSAAIAVHRGELPDVEATLRSLEALVEELEKRKR